MKRAASDLANFSDDLLFKKIAEGLALIVDNAVELDDAARCLHEGGHYRASAIMRGNAREEAAKVLILLDLVRCPRRFQGRSRVARRFYGHVAKRIYAMTCDYPRIWTFGEVSRLVEAESRPYHLDGPNWVDWIFVNSVTSDREQALYVDFVQSLTPEEAEYFWNAPAAESEPVSPRYQTPNCVALIHALSELGAKTANGLSALAGIWRGFTPEPGTDREEIYRLNTGTLEELSALPNTPSDEAASRFIRQIWSFPLWSLEIEELHQQDLRGALKDLRRERELTIAWIEQTEAKRDPKPDISRETVEELSAAYATWNREADELPPKSPPDGGFRFTSSDDMEKSLALPSFATVRELFRRLTEDEKAALLALGWFEKERVAADWPRIYERARNMASGIGEHYHIHMGNHWLGGLNRWEGEPKPFTAGRLRNV